MNNTDIIDLALLTGEESQHSMEHAK